MGLETLEFIIIQHSFPPFFFFFFFGASEEGESLHMPKIGGTS